MPLQCRFLKYHANQRSAGRTLYPNDVSRVQFLSVVLCENPPFRNACSQKVVPSANIVELPISKPRTTYMYQLLCKNIFLDFKFFEILIRRDRTESRGTRNGTGVKLKNAAGCDRGRREAGPDGTGRMISCPTEFWCERSRSKKKIEKNFLRNSMSDQRPSDWTIFAVELDIEIDFDQVIDEFSASHADQRILLRWSSSSTFFQRCICILYMNVRLYCCFIENENSSKKWTRWD